MQTGWLHDVSACPLAPPRRPHFSPDPARSLPGRGSGELSGARGAGSSLPGPLPASTPRTCEAEHAGMIWMWWGAGWLRGTLVAVSGRTEGQCRCEDEISVRRLTVPCLKSSGWPLTTDRAWLISIVFLAILCTSHLYSSGIQSTVPRIHPYHGRGKRRNECQNPRKPERCAQEKSGSADNCVSGCARRGPAETEPATDRPPMAQPARIRPSPKSPANSCLASQTCQPPTSTVDNAPRFVMRHAGLHDD